MKNFKATQVGAPNLKLLALAMASILGSSAALAGEEGHAEAPAAGVQQQVDGSAELTHQVAEAGIGADAGLSQQAEPALGADAAQSQADMADPSTESLAPADAVQDHYQYEQATTREAPQPVSIESLVDTPVVNAAGEQLGEVREVVINSDSGDVGLVLSTAGDKQVLAPVEQISVMGDELVWQTTLDAEAIQESEEYSAQSFHRLSDIGAK